MHVSKTRSNFPNLEIGGALMGSGRNLTPNAAGGVKSTELGLAVRRLQLSLSSVSIAVTEALDYASLKLVDFPDGNYLVVGANVDLSFTGTGGVDTPEDMDVGVGTAAASASTLATTMIDIAAKIDASAGGVVQGGGAVNLVLAASSDAAYLNVAGAIDTDGTMVMSGTVELFYIDLGDPAA